MSRLRRLVLSDRCFFVTCNLLRSRRALGEHDLGRLAPRPMHQPAIALPPQPPQQLSYPAPAQLQLRAGLRLRNVTSSCFA